MLSQWLRRPSATLPIAMSAAALALVVGQIAVVGTARQADEGTAAHLWQLLMAAQLPLVLHFIARWLVRGPRQAYPVLLVQVGAFAAALAPIYLLGW